MVGAWRRHAPCGMTWRTLSLAPYDHFKHHRRSVRLPAHDYAQPGAYFVTMVTKNRECLFGDIIDGKVNLTGLGEIVREEWERSCSIRAEMALDVFVVMPNHIHGIVIITNRDGLVDPGSVGAHGRAPLHRAPRSLGSFVAGFKSAVTKRINDLRGTPGWSVWQRNYHERIVRDEDELYAKRRYIAFNPGRWRYDRENPGSNVG